MSVRGIEGTALKGQALKASPASGKYPSPKQLMGAGKIKFEHLRKTKDLARHIEGNQGDKANLPSSRNQSSRDKELTKRRHGYQNYFFSASLDKVQKPYYCGIKNPHQRCLTTTALHGLAPALSTRAFAAPPRETSALCK
jgi:hypothetical protein